MTEQFGDLLRALRREAGRSQAEQAEAMNRVMGSRSAPMTRNEISRYERGARVPRPRIIVVFARSFDSPPGELLRAAARERDRRCVVRSRVAPSPSDVALTPTRVVSPLQGAADDTITRRHALLDGVLAVEASWVWWRY